jgi:hypothetical protein
MALKEKSSELGVLHHSYMERWVEGGKGEAIERDRMTFSAAPPKDEMQGAFYSEMRQQFFKVSILRDDAPELFEVFDEVKWLQESVQGKYHLDPDLNDR